MDQCDHQINFSSICRSMTYILWSSKFASYLEDYLLQKNLIRLQELLKYPNCQTGHLDINSLKRTGLKLRPNPLCPVLERTLIRGAVNPSSYPPLNKPHPPQSSESQPFPMPILPHPDIPVGGRLAHFVEQWGELTNNKWVLSIVRDRFRMSFRSIPPLSSVPMSESVFLPVTGTRLRIFLRNGQWKGYKIWDLPALFPAISFTKKERKVTSGNRSFATKSIYKETTIQNGDSQISTSINIGPGLDCLHRLTDAYLHVPIHPRS